MRRYRNVIEEVAIVLGFCLALYVYLIVFVGPKIRVVFSEIMYDGPVIRTLEWSADSNCLLVTVVGGWRIGGGSQTLLVREKKIISGVVPDVCDYSLKVSSSGSPDGKFRAEIDRYNAASLKVIRVSDEKAILEALVVSTDKIIVLPSRLSNYVANFMMALVLIATIAIQVKRGRREALTPSHPTLE